MKNFISPHVHIQSLDSASTAEAFVKKELELGTGAITVTDHGTLQACRNVYELAKKNKLIPILGLEAYVRDEECPIIKAAGLDPKEYLKFDKNNLSYMHITMHFQDQHAYETACRLISKAPLEQHGSEAKPIFTWKDLEEIGATNTVLSSGCLIGVVQRHLLAFGNMDIAENYFLKVKNIAKPGNFVVEVFPHVCNKFWEAAVYIHFSDGTKEKFKQWKNLKTDSRDKPIKAMELTHRFNPKKVENLVAVMENRSWVERPAKMITKVEYTEGFIENDCKPWNTTTDFQLDCNRFVLDLAKKHGVPVLCSDDSHFTDPEFKAVQDVRLMSGGDTWRFANSYHRYSSAEAFEYFKTYMNIPQAEFEGWVDNSYAWRDSFKDFKFVDRKSLPSKFYPSDTKKHALALIKKHGRFQNTPEYRERLSAEFKLLHENGTIDLLPYFFLGEEVCEQYAKAGLLNGPGRGSAAGTLISYLFGITHVDPLKYGLSLDRFLTLDRIKSGNMPDIDFDFPDRTLLIGDGTEENKGWLSERFGDHYVQISTDTSLKLRSAAKDAARVLNGGRIPPEVELLTKKFQNAPQGITDRDFIFGYGSEGDYVEGSIKTDPALQEFIQKYPREWEVVQQALGLTRQKSIHASAFLIANEPVSNFIPLTKIGKIQATQYTAKWVEKSGGIKMDFLRVKSLQDVGACIKLIQKRSGLEIASEYKLNGVKVPGYQAIPHKGEIVDVWNLPDDQAVYNTICEQDTETVFQFNTGGAKKWLKSFDYAKSDAQLNGVEHKLLDSIEALAAFTALDRPGPLDAYVTGENNQKHNMLVEYTRRARGLKHSTDSLEILQELLPETFGTLIYQEQLTRIFQIMGKTTGAQAEEFRRHVAKKMPMEMAKDKELFMAGAIEQIGEAQAQRLWDTLETFANYGFNKCVTGDTLVYRAGANKDSGNTIRIDELYQLQSSKTAMGGKIRCGKARLLQMDSDGRVRPGYFKQVIDNGIRPVFEVTTASGKKIRATANHRLLTDRGYRQISEMTTSTRLIVMENSTPYSKKPHGHCTGRGRGKSYNQCGMPSGPANPSWIDGRTGLLRAAKEEVLLRSQNNCETCGIANDGNHEFAHQSSLTDLNGDFSRYHNKENLKLLCNPCHKTLDYSKRERVPAWTKGKPTSSDQIVSIEAKGEERVYDIEMIDENHNFIANGIVSHNSHAVCYVKISYATAWLKYHYPLEWWTSVLSFAEDRNEIYEKFWAHCGHLIDMPDISLSGENFEIVGDRIRAPISLLNGIGPKAHDQILALRPYSTIEEFLIQIEKYKVENAVLDPKTGKKRKAQCSVRDGLIYSLIVAGTADSLFPAETTLNDKLLLYEEAKARVKKAKSVTPPKAEYTNLSRLNLYQFKKAVLPSYADNLLPLLIDPPFPWLVKQEDSKMHFPWKMAYKAFRQSRNGVWKDIKEVPFVSLAGLEKMEAKGHERKNIHIAIFGYIAEVKFKTYGAENKTMVEIVMDIEGKRKSYVKWPDQSGALPPKFNADLKGALAVLVLREPDQNKPFYAEEITVVSPPLSRTDTEEESK